MKEKVKLLIGYLNKLTLVVRFQGGHNAGHTLVIDGITYKLRLLPSGIVRKEKYLLLEMGLLLILGLY